MNLKTPLNGTIVHQLQARRTYVSSTEVMSILGVSRKTLCGWINSGTLSAYRLGKSNVCDPQILAEWIEDRSTR